MPNIEIHGLQPTQGALSTMHERLQSSFKGTPYRNDIVVTYSNDNVCDLGTRSRPFLRVIFAKDDPIEVGGVRVYDDCLKRLAELNMDIEVVIIHKFIPKKG